MGALSEATRRQFCASAGCANRKPGGFVPEITHVERATHAFGRWPLFLLVRFGGALRWPPLYSPSGVKLISVLNQLISRFLSQWLIQTQIQADAEFQAAGEFAICNSVRANYFRLKTKGLCNEFGQSSQHQRHAVQ